MPRVIISLGIQLVVGFSRRAIRLRYHNGISWKTIKVAAASFDLDHRVPQTQEQTRKSPETFGFMLRERESFVRWPSNLAVDRTTCWLSTALEGHRTEDLYGCSPSRKSVHNDRSPGDSSSRRSDSRFNPGCAAFNRSTTSMVMLVFSTVKRPRLGILANASID